MKKTLIALATCLTCFSTSAFAADFYIQGQLGMASFSDMTTEPVFTPETGTMRINAQINDSVLFGFEGGMTNFEPKNVLRLGLAIQSTTVDIDSVVIHSEEGGTNPNFPQGSYEVPRSTLDAVGDLDIEGSATVYSVNLYYDFPTETIFKPFISFGLGAMDLGWADSMETGFVYSLGANFEFTDSMSFGVKYQNFQAKSPSKGAYSLNHVKFGTLAGTFTFKF